MSRLDMKKVVSPTLTVSLEIVKQGISKMKANYLKNTSPKS